MTGTTLQRGARVAFGSAIVASDSYDPRAEPGTSLWITTPAHPPGVVDVTVTNPDRGAVTLTAAYEFVDQQAFDLNGNWSGVTVDGSDILVEFSIRNNVLVSAACQRIEKASTSFSTEASNGGFSAESADGFRLSGRMVSASQATGKMLARACFDGETAWYASKVK
jgi:hypothetical protein